MTVPKLICDAVKDEMDDTDKVLAVLSAQQALKNLTNKIKSNQLQYVFILYNQLQVCIQELHETGKELLITNQNSIQVALMSKTDHQ